MIYKLRAECYADIEALVLTVRPVWIKVLFHQIFPDVTCIFESNLSLPQIEGKLATIEDGHVMFETVATEEKYDGNRRLTK